MSIKEQIDKIERRWYAVQCKFRCEKNLMNEFLESGLEVYVPLQKKVKQYASKKKVSGLALIPSHIFVRIRQDEYLKVLRHPHVFQFLNFSGKITCIPHGEIEIMRRVVGAFDNIVMDSAYYSVGDRVQIISGELTGLEGILIEEANHNFKIELTSLGIGLMIKVDPKQLFKIGSCRKVA